MTNIAAMTKADLAEAAELEKAAFSDAWSLKMLFDYLEAPGAHGYVFRRDNMMLGYLCATFWRGGGGEIYRIACRENARRHGVATALLVRLIADVKRGGGDHIFLEVREQNIAARRLYEKFGFQKTGIRKNYYNHPTDNAVCYQFVLHKTKQKEEKA